MPKRTTLLRQQGTWWSTHSAAQDCGLNFEVEHKPVFVNSHADIYQVPGVQSLIRSDTDLPIGSAAGVVTGMTYKPIQFGEWFGVLDGLLVEHPGAHISSAGTWDNGKYGFMTADFGEDGGPDGYPYRKKITLRVVHDGKTATTGEFSCLRLVCTNGLIAASPIRIVKIAHRGDVQEKLKEAHKLVKAATHYWDWFGEQAQAMQMRDLVKTEVLEVLKELVPDPVVEGSEEPSVRAINIREKKRDAIYNLFMHGQGNSGRTAWDLWNGVVEHVDHSKDWVNSNFQGGAKEKQDAFNTINDFVGV